jgi:hypothetical protein
MRGIQPPFPEFLSTGNFGASDRDFTCKNKRLSLKYCMFEQP